MGRLRDAVECLSGRRGLSITYKKRRADIVSPAHRDFWFIDYNSNRAKGAWRVALASPPHVLLWGGQEKTHRKRYFATAKEATDFLIGELRGEGL
jgi:hypothetical protein